MGDCDPVEDGREGMVQAVAVRQYEWSERAWIEREKVVSSALIFEEAQMNVVEEVRIEGVVGHSRPSRDVVESCEGWKNQNQRYEVQG